MVSGEQNHVENGWGQKLGVYVLCNLSIFHAPSFFAQ